MTFFGAENRVTIVHARCDKGVDWTVRTVCPASDEHVSAAEARRNMSCRQNQIHINTRHPEWLQQHHSECQSVDVVSLWVTVMNCVKTAHVPSDCRYEVVTFSRLLTFGGFYALNIHETKWEYFSCFFKRHCCLTICVAFNHSQRLHHARSSFIKYPLSPLLRSPR